MRHISIVCLLLCACASTVQSRQVIENIVPAPPLPTLADNMAATVSVFYTFRNPFTGEMFHRQVIGVVIDSQHVLAFALIESDAAWLKGWTKAKLEYAAVTGYTPDAWEHLIDGPAPANTLFAKVVAENDGVAILQVAQPLPILPVTLAKEIPHTGQTAYALGHQDYNSTPSADDKPALRVWNSTIAEPMMVYYWQYVFAQDFGIKWFDGEKHPAQCGVFNRHHEFIGLMTLTTIELAGSSSVLEYGYRVISLKSLAPLFQQAGVAYNKN